MKMNRTLPAFVALALLCGCKPHPSAPAGNQAQGNAAAPKPGELSATSDVAPDLAKAGLHDWLVGTWSLEGGCPSDLVVRYDAKGALDNAGDTGSWTIDGDRVTETITAHQGLGEAPEKVDPAEKRSYRVVRGDADHGMIEYERRNVSIKRC